MNSTVLIYPKFKKLPKTQSERLYDIDKLSNHYVLQFYQAMKNHGIKEDPMFFKDLGFLREMLKAIMMRSQDEYHSLQDWMNDAYIEELAVDDDDIYDE